MQEAESPRKDKPSRMMVEHAEALLAEEFDAVLINYLGNKCDAVGKLVLTDFRCVFITTKQTMYHDNEIKFDFPIGYISRCDSSSEMVNKAMIFYIEIVTKFLLGFKLRSSSPNLVRASEHINKMMGTEHVSFGEKRGDTLQDTEFCKKWQFYSSAVSLQLEEAIDYDNLNWINLPMYPSIIKVPKPFITKKNPLDRIVFLTFVCESKNVGLWRNGPGRPDADEAKWLPFAAKKPDHMVLQIKNRALGSSKSAATRMVELDGPPLLRESFSKMLYSSCYQSEQLEMQQKWLVHVNSSRWMEQVEILLAEAYLVYDKLNEGLNVTLMSDWDVRSAQISALVQIISRPESRTIAGFANLIEREFLHFSNWHNPLSKKEKGEEKGIAIIQFLDCVFQLAGVYPLSFEFNEDLLTYLATHVYSRKYGNFLFATRVNSEEDRLRCIKFGCIWQKIAKSKSSFLNSFYVDSKECDVFELKKKISMKNLRVWSSFFLRDIFMYGSTLEINSFRENQRIVSQRHQAARMQTEQLRKRIADQHRAIQEKKAQLKELHENKLD